VLSIEYLVRQASLAPSPSTRPSQHALQVSSYTLSFI
jgi:hypothetical protein